MRWQLAALDVLRKAIGLEAALRTNHPSDRQPRVPRGNPDGGQWTDGGGQIGPTRERPVVLAQFDPKRRIEINVAEERNYGHVYTRHVRKTDVELFKEMRPLTSIYPTPYELRPIGFCTLKSLQDAQYYINEPIDSNRERVAQIIKDGSGETERMEMRFGSPTGREAVRPSAAKAALARSLTMQMPESFCTFATVIYPTIMQDATCVNDILDWGLSGVGKARYEEFRSYVTWALDGGLTDEELEEAWMTPSPSFGFSPEHLRHFLTAAVDRSYELERAAG